MGRAQFFIDYYIPGAFTDDMRRLIVNPGTDSAWEIPLRNGVATLGRVEGNDYVLDHPSISDQHCEISVQAGTIAVKDLGSLNGTFIGDQPVTASRLLPGQILRIGEVQLRLEENAPTGAPVRVLTPVPAPPTAASARCRFHPRNPARWFCPKCHSSFCELCVNARAVGGESRSLCRTCAVECTPVEVDREEPVAHPEHADRVALQRDDDPSPRWDVRHAGDDVAGHGQSPR